MEKFEFSIVYNTFEMHHLNILPPARAAAKIPENLTSISNS